MKNYFDFIMYLAFETLLIYENKRSLTVEQLHNYRAKLVESHIKYYSQFTVFDDEQFEENLHFFHDSNTDMTNEEEGQCFLDFINDNDDLFSYKNGVISLKEGISHKKLQQAKFDLESYSDRDDKIICGTLISRHDCIECLNVLGAQKVQNFVHRIIDDEKQVENAYQTNSGLELQQNIEKVQNLSARI